MNKPKVSLKSGYHLTAHDRKLVIGAINHWEFLIKTQYQQLRDKLGFEKTPGYWKVWISFSNSRKRIKIAPTQEPNHYFISILKKEKDDWGRESNNIQTAIVEVKSLPQLPIFGEISDQEYWNDIPQRHKDYLLSFDNHSESNQMSLF